MGKKKATGMSKRLGFTDRATIAENKDILRYNDRLEREAEGAPQDEPKRGSGPRRERPARPEHPARPHREQRPPALDDEQRATLQAALVAAVGESGLEAAGARVIDRLAAHDSFDRATTAGWEVASAGHAADRSASEWELLRKTWLALRLALLESYATIKPDLEPVLARERKQLTRIERPQRPPRAKRRSGNRKPAKDAATAVAGDAVTEAAHEVTPGAGAERPAVAPPVRSGPPSPADVARRVAAQHAAAADPIEYTEHIDSVDIIGAGGDADSELSESESTESADGVAPDGDEPSVTAELRADHAAVAAPVPVAVDAHADADSAEQPDEETAQEPPKPAPVETDEQQLTLEL